jgi:hypothetical protein
MPKFQIKSELGELTFDTCSPNTFYIVLQNCRTSKSYHCFEDLRQIGVGITDPFRFKYIEKYFKDVTEIIRVETPEEHSCHVTFRGSSVSPDIVLRLVRRDRT